MFRKLWLLFFLLCWAPQPAQAEPIHGLYLDEEWLISEKPEPTVATLHARLSAAGIRDLYLQVRNVGASDLGAQSARLLAQIKARNPLLRLIPFLGRRVCTTALPKKCLDLRNPSDTQRLQSQVIALWRLGYDGVQLDLEPVASGDAAFLQLLDQLKKLRPAGKLLSVSGYMFEPSPEIQARVHISPRGDATPLYWSRAYYREVLRRVDALVLMNYDTGIRSAEEYRHWTTYQLRELLALHRELGGRSVQLGIPAYKYGRRGLFSPQAETAVVAIAVAQAVLHDRCPAPVGLTPYHESELPPELWPALVGYTQDSAAHCRHPTP